ncbi:hypothetical protein EDD31_0739 [Bogoriella caseilytica]|uniref:Uncharacterized protein n=1 Tax=Bogoriella caseilytica TaxID=56055 RepID=A0A3N2BAZ9_9MICO|nr:hypothetical protein EDD31_0739 [Bogoriella caseilytica]
MTPARFETSAARWQVDRAMPADLALATSLVDLVAGARVSVLCSKYNSQD